jgi:hypothetical protein
MMGSYKKCDDVQPTPVDARPWASVVVSSDCSWSGLRHMTQYDIHSPAVQAAIWRFYWMVIIYRAKWFFGGLFVATAIITFVAWVVPDPFHQFFWCLCIGIVFFIVCTIADQCVYLVHICKDDIGVRLDGDVIHLPCPSSLNRNGASTCLSPNNDPEVGSPSCSQASPPTPNCYSGIQLRHQHSSQSRNTGDSESAIEIDAIEIDVNKSMQPALQASKSRGQNIATSFHLLAPLDYDY